MKVRFMPMDKEVEIDSNESVLHAAQRSDIYIKSICKGIPSCAECRIYIIEGEHNVVPPSNIELQLIGTAHFVDRRRLACQLRCFGDITVDVSEQAEKSDLRRTKLSGEQSQAVAGNIMQESQNLEDANEREAQRIIELQEKEMLLRQIKSGATQTVTKPDFYKNFHSDDSQQKSTNENTNRNKKKKRRGNNRNRQQNQQKKSPR